MNINVQITRQENAEYFNCAIGDVVSIDFEEYVAAVVASEIGNSNWEACRAQAVAARTYAITYISKVISDSSSSAQAYRAKRYNTQLYPTCIAAAEDTAGQILYYKNGPISAVYSHCNGGRTTSSKERWGTEKPYLISQYDAWDAATGQEKKGHGVGMSQVGAIYAGSQGVNYTDILDFYYPGTLLYDNYGEPRSKAVKIKIEELKQLHAYIADIQAQLKEIGEKL